MKELGGKGKKQRKQIKQERGSDIQKDRKIKVNIYITREKSTIQEMKEERNKEETKNEESNCEGMNEKRVRIKKA